MAPAGRRRRQAPLEALLDELVGEILCRIPPDDLASLLRAALVCKRWGRIISDPGFRRRFREFHRTPPLLGFFRYRSTSVSTSSFRGRPAALYNFHRRIDRRHGRVLDHRLMDARHGRVLLWNSRSKFVGSESHLIKDFTVWNPITADGSELPLPETSQRPVSWNAAVLCASTDGTCDHLDCGRGHFLVVYVYKSETGMFAHVYSSETAAWSEEISARHLPLNDMDSLYWLPSALAGNALYFVCSLSAVLKFDMAAREMSLIHLPWDGAGGRSILRTTEGGQLGRADISSDGLYLYLWSREVGPDEDAGWAQRKVIELRKLLSDVPSDSLHLVGSAHGHDVFLVGSSEGVFTIDLKSIKATKVHRDDCLELWFPYMSFYTLALGAALPRDQEQAPQMPD